MRAPRRERRQPSAARIATAVQKFRTLRFVLTAEVAADAGESGNRQDECFQRIYLDVPAPRMKGRKRDDQYRACCSNHSQEAVGRIADLVVEQLSAMLVWDTRRTFKPVGCRPGKCYGIHDGARTLIGLHFHEDDGRRWVRVDNGFLLNLPID